MTARDFQNKSERKITISSLSRTILLVDCAPINTGIHEMHLQGRKTRHNNGRWEIRKIPLSTSSSPFWMIQRHHHIKNTRISLLRTYQYSIQEIEFKIQKKSRHRHWMHCVSRSSTILASKRTKTNKSSGRADELEALRAITIKLF